MARRIMMFFLISTLLLSMSITVLASENAVSAGCIADKKEDETLLCEDDLMSALSDVEQQKENIGLKDVDFQDLCIGNPIRTYIYVDDTFIESYPMFPIMEKDNLVLWAYELNNSVQLTTGLVEKVNSNVSSAAPFAIIYDKDKAYLYCNEEFTLLAISPYENNTRSVLDPYAKYEDSNIKLTSLDGTSSLNYLPTRSSTVYRLNVGFVSQDLSSLGINRSNICWAAVTASIVNYRTGQNLSAVNVAQRYYPPGNFNEPIEFSEFPDVLDLYNLNYTHNSYLPSDGVILENIQAGYPIASGWGAPNYTNHACTIYGTNPISGYHYLMDPLTGFTTAVAGTNGYTYVSAANGATYTFNNAACNSW